MTDQLMDCITNPVKCKLLLEIYAQGKATAKHLADIYHDILKEDMTGFSLSPLYLFDVERICDHAAFLNGGKSQGNHFPQPRYGKCAEIPVLRAGGNRDLPCKNRAAGTVP